MKLPKYAVNLRSKATLRFRVPPAVCILSVRTNEIQLRPSSKYIEFARDIVIIGGTLSTPTTPHTQSARIKWQMDKNVLEYLMGLERLAYRYPTAYNAHSPPWVSTHNYCLHCKAFRWRKR